MSSALQCSKRINRAWRALCSLRIFCVVIIAAAQAAAPVIPVKELRKVTIAGEEFLVVGFDTLSAFEYTIVDAGTGATPEDIERTAAALRRAAEPSAAG